MSVWDRPLPFGMRPENQIHYADPPADIARVFGLRPFYDATGAHTPFRIGLWHGIGWHLPVWHQLPDGTNMVRVTKRRDAGDLYDIQFCHFEWSGEDNLDPPAYAVRQSVSAPLAGLVEAYASILGKDAVL